MLPLLEAVLLALVVEVRPRRPEVDDLGPSQPHPPPASAMERIPILRSFPPPRRTRRKPSERFGQQARERGGATKGHAPFHRESPVRKAN